MYGVNRGQFHSPPYTCLICPAPFFERPLVTLSILIIVINHVILQLLALYLDSVPFLVSLCTSRPSTALS